MNVHVGRTTVMGVCAPYSGGIPCLSYLDPWELF